MIDKCLPGLLDPTRVVPEVQPEQGTFRAFEARLNLTILMVDCGEERITGAIQRLIAAVADRCIHGATHGAMPAATIRGN